MNNVRTLWRGFREGLYYFFCVKEKSLIVCKFKITRPRCCICFLRAYKKLLRWKYGRKIERVLAWLEDLALI